MGGKPAKLLGERFGKLTVVAHIPSDARWAARWRCRCDCGQVILARSTELTTRYGLRSCGCSPQPDDPSPEEIERMKELLKAEHMEERRSMTYSKFTGKRRGRPCKSN